jgi:multiple sugar transport system permease protein
MNWPRTLWQLTRHLILLATAFVVLVPFIWMVSLSLRPPGEIFQSGFSLLPQTWFAAENYAKAFASAPLARYLVNGIMVCASILTLQIAVCAPAAYALAKIDFIGRDLVFGVVLLCLLIPHQVLALPLFILSYRLGLIDTYAVLILPFAVSPFGIFLFRQFFKRIPDDLVYAARLDGLSEFSIVWRLMLPMSGPAVVAFAIFSVVSHWNDLFWPLIVVHSDRLMPPALGVMAFRNEQAGNDYGPLMAAATIVVAPLVLAFLIAQKWFVEGFAGGSIK